MFGLSSRTSPMVIHEDTSSDVCLSPVRDPELRMRLGCVLHSPPDKGALEFAYTTWETYKILLN